MRILIVVPAFPLDIENVKGGVSSALSNLLKGFSKADVTVRVITFNRTISAPQQTVYSNNITIHYIPESKLPHVVNFAFKGSSIIKTQIREFDPAVVHYVMSGYILVSKIFGLQGKVPLVTIHGVPFLEARIKEDLKDKVVYFTNGIAEWLLCPANVIHISRYSKAQYKLSAKSKTVVIPNAINDRYFNLPLKTGTDNKLVYIGTIEPRKNLLYVLQALKALLDRQINYTLSVLGGFSDEQYKGTILSYVAANHLEAQVDFCGWQPQPKVQEILTESDILIMASKQETLPMVIAEAMSAGKVVVSSKAGGIPEMISDGEDGFLFDISSINNVLPILELLHNNHTLIQQVQTKARSKAMATYHCDQVAQKTIDFYKTLHN